MCECVAPKIKPQILSRAVLQRLKEDLEAHTGLQWAETSEYPGLKESEIEVCPNCYMFRVDHKLEPIKVVYAYALTTTIPCEDRDDIVVHISGKLRTGGHDVGFRGEWSWWQMMTRPGYVAYDDRLTGDNGDTPVGAWDNLQPLIDQWKTRPERLHFR